MLDPNRQYLFFKWPQYLAQWYAHENYRIRHAADDVLQPYMYDCNRVAYQLDPVQTLRDSTERLFLSDSLRKPPSDMPVVPSDDVTICIEIPDFKYRDPNIYNYLPPQGEQIFEGIVRARLKVSLWNFMQKGITGDGIPLNGLLSLYMDQYGIEVSDTNYETLKKIYYRQCETYRMAEYRRKHKKQ